MSITYKLAQRGLCSELNSLIGFYDSITEKQAQAYIDGKQSQYFKNVDIYDVFKFSAPFILKEPSTCNISTSSDWKISAGRNYQPTTSKKILSKLFTYTKEFQKKIDKEISNLNLPKTYSCFHIRRGDKVGERYHAWAAQIGKFEANRKEFSEYLESNPGVDKVFIMTDDYKCIQEAHSYIEDNKLSIDIFYLTKEAQLGRSQHFEISNNYTYPEQELVQFFAEIEIAKHSEMFTGTKSSNVYRYIMNTCITNTKFISLD